LNLQALPNIGGSFWAAQMNDLEQSVHDDFVFLGFSSSHGK
jgi:hypothetical protein